jgi:hypothetical protein
MALSRTLLTLAQQFDLAIEVASLCSSLDLAQLQRVLTRVCESFQLLDVLQKLRPRVVDPLVPRRRQPSEGEWMDRGRQLRKHYFVIRRGSARAEMTQRGKSRCQVAFDELGPSHGLWCIEKLGIVQ